MQAFYWINLTFIGRKTIQFINFIQMTSQKLFNTKRNHSEAQFSYSHHTTSTTLSGNNNTCSGSESGVSGTSSVGDVEDDDDSSHLSDLHSGLLLTKRIKCTFENMDASTPEAPGNTSATKEFGHINDAQFLEASKVAHSMNGECLSHITIGLGNILSFKCKFGHIFRTTIFDAYNNWCPTCIKYFDQCSNFAKENNGKLMDIVLTTPVTFQCKNGHKFTCRSYRMKYLRWCDICKQEQEALRKERIEQQKVKNSETMNKEQEELFEKAKAEMEKERRSYANNYELALEQLIRTRTLEEIKDGKLTETESYWVNKLLITPFEILSKFW